MSRIVPDLQSAPHADSRRNVSELPLSLDFTEVLLKESSHSITVLIQQKVTVGREGRDDCLYAAFTSPGRQRGEGKAGHNQGNLWLEAGLREMRLERLSITRDNRQTRVLETRSEMIGKLRIALDAEQPALGWHSL